MSKGKSLTKICPLCKQRGVREWRGTQLAGEDCFKCGWGEWWKIGKENIRLPSAPKINAPAQPALAGGRKAGVSKSKLSSSALRH